MRTRVEVDLTLNLLDAVTFTLTSEFVKRNSA